MDEFKPEDELKPDTSDRRPPRSRKASSPKVPVSRQHMMMGVGILVLLLLVLGIGSALKSPAPSGEKSAQQPAPAGASAEKNIDLSGSSSMSGQNAGQPSPAGQQATSPQALSAPPVSSTPTEAASVPVPENQQRVDLPGDLNNALNDQQASVDTASQAAISTSSLPTGQATVGGSGSRPTSPAKATPLPKATTPSGSPHHAAAPQNRSEAKHKVVARQPVVREKHAAVPAAHATQRKNAEPAVKSHTASSGNTARPAGNYTLQLSGASRSDSLQSWAKQQNLNSYHVYQTTRNGQPWYVLVSGSYATSAEAKRAVAALPADVRAKNPWVKPVSQVKKEAGK